MQYASKSLSKQKHFDEKWVSVMLVMFMAHYNVSHALWCHFNSRVRARSHFRKNRLFIWIGRQIGHLYPCRATFGGKGEAPSRPVAMATPDRRVLRHRNAQTFVWAVFCLLRITRLVRVSASASVCVCACVLDLLMISYENAWRVM